MRDNDVWVAALRGEDALAIADLRGVLLRNLRKALSGRPRADEAFLEDATQDAVLRVLDRLDSFAGRSRFVTWATSIAIHVAMSELRLARWKDVSIETLTADRDRAYEPPADPAPSPAETHERHAMLDALRRTIDTALSPRQRTALLAELRGMPMDEIARQLGSNRNAVYKLTHDARKKLRAELEAAGYSADDLDTTTH